MYLKKSIFFLFFCLLLCKIAYSQVQGSRYATYEGFLVSVPQTQFLPKASMVMQNSRGFFSAQNQMAWGAFLSENIEFLRWKNKNIIAFQALQEVNADLQNDIGFNPKMSVWMEQFYYLRKLRKGQLAFGFQHRSKHDIDNGEPTVWDTTKRFFPESRVVILNGAYTSWQHNFKRGDNFSGKLLTRYEWYLVSYDSRFPYQKDKIQSWQHAKMSLLNSVLFEQKIIKDWLIYNQNWLNTVYFSQETRLKFNYRIELGLGLLGEKARGRVFIAYEYFFDNLMNPYPFSSATLWFGARVNSKNIW